MRRCPICGDWLSANGSKVRAEQRADFMRFIHIYIMDIAHYTAMNRSRWYPYQQTFPVVATDKPGHQNESPRATTVSQALSPTVEIESLSKKTSFTCRGYLVQDRMLALVKKKLSPDDRSQSRISKEIISNPVTVRSSIDQSIVLDEEWGFRRSALEEYQHVLDDDKRLSDTPSTRQIPGSRPLLMRGDSNRGHGRVWSNGDEIGEISWRSTISPAKRLLLKVNVNKRTYYIPQLYKNRRG